MTDTTLAATPVTQTISPAREVWLSLKANKGAMAGLVVIIVIVLAAIFADVIAPHHYAEVFKECVTKPCPPVWEGGDARFILGTDAVGGGGGGGGRGGGRGRLVMGNEEQNKNKNKRPR
jgi:dipeptide transport system permease protein